MFLFFSLSLWWSFSFTSAPLELEFKTSVADNVIQSGSRAALEARQFLTSPDFLKAHQNLQVQDSYGQTRLDFATWLCLRIFEKLKLLEQVATVAQGSHAAPLVSTQQDLCHNWVLDVLGWSN